MTRVLGVVALLAAVAWGRLEGQVAPDLHWQTIPTAHFRVHFPDGLEVVARRAAGSAERAWERLAHELVSPRGPVELVVADNVDYSNGYATIFPSNRIVVYARPPVDGTALKFLDDWFDLVITHELTHIFHLDRSRGWWRLAQSVLGRNPFVFPSLYTPSWMDEGIAVYYESRLTGSGRIVGAGHAAVVRAHLLDGAVPRPNSWSAATTRFPLGEIPYAYGSLVMDRLARPSDGRAMRSFVEGSAEQAVPYLLDRNARDAFGFGLDSALRLLVDSLRRTTSSASTEALTLRTSRGWFAERLRWTGADRLIFSRDDGRTLPALAELRLDESAPRTIAARNAFGTTSPLPDGSRIVAQPDYVDPYTVRSDLYRERDGEWARLTVGARLVQPDAWCAGVPCVPRIVATELVGGSSRLVRLEGEARRALTSAALDTIWSEPRWSHEGTRVVAVRRVRGAVSDVVVLDANGAIVTSVGRARGVTVAPSWSHDDAAVYFTSDRTGRAALYRATLATGAVERIAEGAAGLFESEESPDGRWLATLALRGDGYHVAILPVGGRGTPVDTTSVYPPSRGDSVVTVSAASAPARPYAAWRALLPTYWLPTATTSDLQRTNYGVMTSGTDVIGRHRYSATVAMDPGRAETSWDLSYGYAGLGNPQLSAWTTAEWDHFAVADSLRRPLGTLDRRKRFVGSAVMFQRIRYRSSAYLTVSADLELRDFATTPSSLLARLGPSYARSYQYPTLAASIGFGNARTTTLGISPEDGVQLAATLRQRWRSDAASSTNSTSLVGYVQGFRGLDFGGPAHAVLAARVSAAWADDRAASEFQAGGSSGSILALAPGVTVGEGRRTFFVRGFPASAQFGTRALGASAELRLPLLQPSRGLWMLPLFLQKVNATLFTDAATAWCPTGTTNTTVCGGKSTPAEWMQSVGAEVQFDTALQYDLPYRLRLGAATPVTGARYARSRGATMFFSVGVPF